MCVCVCVCVCVLGEGVGGGGGGAEWKELGKNLHDLTRQKKSNLSVKRMHGKV